MNNHICTFKCGTAGNFVMQFLVNRVSSPWSTWDRIAPHGGSTTFCFGARQCYTLVEEDGSKGQAQVACFIACMRSMHATGRIFEDPVTDLQHIVETALRSSPSNGK